MSCRIREGATVFQELFNDSLYAMRRNNWNITCSCNQEGTKVCSQKRRELRGSRGNASGASTRSSVWTLTSAPPRISSATLVCSLLLPSTEWSLSEKRSVPQSAQRGEVHLPARILQGEKSLQEGGELRWERSACRFSPRVKNGMVSPSAPSSPGAPAVCSSFSGLSCSLSSFNKCFVLPLRL